MIRARSRSICECGIPKKYHSPNMARFYGYIWDEDHPFKAAPHICNNCGEKIYGGDLYYRMKPRGSITIRYCEPCAQRHGHS